MALRAAHRRFVAAILSGKHHADAAIFAGSSPGGANSYAARLLREPEIQRAINEGLDEAFDDAKIELEDLLRTLAGAVYADPSQALEPDGSLRPIQDWPEALRNSLESLDIREVEDPDSGLRVGRVVKLRFIKKTEAIAQLAKLLGLYAPERVEHTVTTADQLGQARARAQARQRAGGVEGLKATLGGTE